MIRHTMIALALGSAGTACAQGLPGPDQSIVILETVAGRGEACGLLAPWRATGLRAMMEMEMSGWDRERRTAVAAAAAERAAQTPCDDEFLNTYIDAAGANMEVELLPPYLVAYRVFATMDEPPEVFRQTALRLDHSDILAAIDTKLAELEASGRPPEGGKPWPDFIALTETRVVGLMESLDGDESGERYSADQAAAMIAQSVLITHSWYEHEAGE